MTGYSSAAFSAAFIVVGLVAVGLDQTVQDAQDAMNKRNADIFNSYFKNVAPFNKNEWYETFREAYYRTSGDPDKAMEIVSAKIDSTVSGFWTDIYKEGNLDLLIAATEADTQNYFTKNNYIFTDELGNRFKPRYVEDTFPKLLEQNGLRKIRFHDLRHTCASLMHKMGLSPKEVQEYLGHSTVSITLNIYTHLDWNSKETAAKVMESVVKLPENEKIRSAWKA